MKKGWITAGLVSIGAICAYGQSLHGTTAFSEIGTVTGNPFTAERDTIQVVTDGKGKKTERTTIVDYVARDSSGRVRIDRPMQPLSPTASSAEIAASPRAIIIFDRANGSQIEINTLNKTARVTEDSRPAPANQAHPPFSAPFFPTSGSKMPTNIQFDDLGYKRIEGVAVHGGRTTQLEPGDPPIPVRVDDWWSSDDLSAVVLEEHLTSKTQVSTRIVLTHIKRVEPDPSLFVIPEGYSVPKTAPGAGHP
jgi:hypothetical protein